MDKKDKFKAALIGALAGIITGILIAPRSGKETRDVLYAKYSDIKDDLMEKLGEVKNITKENYGQIVDEVILKYQKSKRISEEEAEKFKEDLKAGFNKIKDKFDK